MKKEAKQSDKKQGEEMRTPSVKPKKRLFALTSYEENIVLQNNIKSIGN